MAKLRLATHQDIPAILAIYESSRHFMRQTGNANQWTNGYPGERDILADIANGYGYLLYDEEKGIVATFHLSLRCDPSYAIIEGNWHANAPYGVIHRIAVASDAMGKGYASRCIHFAEKIILKNNRHWLRIDTHADNVPMQKVILKNHCQYCGIIHVIGTQTTRWAYDKYLG